MTYNLGIVNFLSGIACFLHLLKVGNGILSLKNITSVRKCMKSIAYTNLKKGSSQLRQRSAHCADVSRRDLRLEVLLHLKKSLRGGGKRGHD